MRSVHTSWCGDARDGVLEEVRERPVPDVVQERGGERVARACPVVTCCQNGRSSWIARRRARRSFITNADAERVREARVLGAGEGERVTPSWRTRRRRCISGVA